MPAPPGDTFYFFLYFVFPFTRNGQDIVLNRNFNIILFDVGQFRLNGVPLFIFSDIYQRRPLCNS